MKKVIYMLVAIGLLNITQSCSDFLEESPESQLVIGNFYNTASDAEAAVNAIYNSLYDLYGRQMALVCDLISDDYKNGIGMSNGQLQDIEYMRLVPENSFNTNYWMRSYAAIARANFAIQNIPNAEMTDDGKNKLIGEAKFLRALFYFNAVRFWGDIPLVTKIESLDDAFIGRSSKSDVYALIIDDLTFAGSALDIVNDAGRATKGAAKILLGKVYLTMEDWQSAANILGEVINSESTYGYALHENFRDNWEISTENGSEMVFSVQYAQSPGTANILMAGTGPKYSVPEGIPPGYFVLWEADIPTLDLFNAFDDTDERKAGTFIQDFISPVDGNTYSSTIPLFYKYWETGETSGVNSDVNYHVIRYADALLMYAEALNEAGSTPQAENMLNRIVERAFNDNTHNYTGLSQGDLREKIRLERRLELACEGHRYFDLNRWGNFVQTMKAHAATEAAFSGESIKNDIAANVSEKLTLFPIPQRERDLNSELTQNDGY